MVASLENSRNQLKISINNKRTQRGDKVQKYTEINSFCVFKVYLDRKCNRKSLIMATKNYKITSIKTNKRCEPL